MSRDPGPGFEFQNGEWYPVNDQLRDVGDVVRMVLPVPDDRLPDQLDVQVAMATSRIRRDVNEARFRLGLEQRDYPPVVP